MPTEEWPVKAPNAFIVASEDEACVNALQVANAPTYYARTRAGDMIYIPDGWWQ